MKTMLMFVFSIFISSNLFTQDIFLSSTDNRLYRLDLNNCDYEFIVEVQSTVFDIAFHPNGNLYGIRGSGELYQINTLTGNTTFVHEFAGQTFNSLTISNDGLIYTIGDEGELWSYQISNGEQIYYGEIGYSATGDLTFYQGNLYAAVAFDRIVLVDINDPMNSSVIIDETVSGDIFGIVSFAEDCNNVNTYAITGGESEIHQIDFINKSFNLICELDFEVGGGASTFEFIASTIVIEDLNTINPNCGMDNGEISINATSRLGPVEYSINGQNFQTNGLFENLSEGTYSIVVIDIDGCTITQNIEISILNLPSIDLVQQTLASCDQSDGLFEVMGNEGLPPFSYAINGISQSDGLFENLAKGNYNIVIQDAAGCSADTTIIITQECPIYVPNIFSPNNDGINDLFKIYPPSDLFATFKSFRIYDRWGATLFEAEDFNPQNIGWNGKFKGEDVGIGVYVYYVEYITESGNQKILKGDITLVRF